MLSAVVPISVRLMIKTATLSQQLIKRGCISNIIGPFSVGAPYKNRDQFDVTPVWTF